MEASIRAAQANKAKLRATRHVRDSALAPSALADDEL